MPAFDLDKLNLVVRPIRHSSTPSETFRAIGVVEGHTLIDMAPRAGALDIDDFGRMTRVNEADLEKVLSTPQCLDTGEVVVPIAASWVYPTGGPQTVAYQGSHLDPERHLAVLQVHGGPHGQGNVCEHCGARLGRYVNMAVHRTTRSCLTTPRRKELAAAGYIHCDGEPQAERLRALGVDVRTEDTSLLAFMGENGDEPFYAPDLWAPAWAVILDRRDTGIHVGVAEWMIRRMVSDETLRAALDAVHRAAGVYAVRDFVYAQPGAEQAWKESADARRT